MTDDDDAADADDMMRRAPGPPGPGEQVPIDDRSAAAAEDTNLTRCSNCCSSGVLNLQEQGVWAFKKQSAAHRNFFK